MGSHCVFVSLRVHVNVCVSVCMRGNVCVNVCSVCLCVCACLYMSLHVCVCPCACACVRVCVCVLKEETRANWQEEWECGSKPAGGQCASWRERWDWDGWAMTAGLREEQSSQQQQPQVQSKRKSPMVVETRPRRYRHAAVIVKNNWKWWQFRETIQVTSLHQPVLGNGV